MLPANGQWLTLAFCITMTLLVISYDVVIIAQYGVDASISRVVRRLFGWNSTLFVALIFWLGVLVGHIWLPTE